VNAQLDLFAAAPQSRTTIEQARHFGRMDALTGWHRLNPYRLQQCGEIAAAYDEAFREARAEMLLKEGTA
jgi:hypothetical protein